MNATSRNRALRGTSRIDSFRSAVSETSAAPAFDIAQQVALNTFTASAIDSILACTDALAAQSIAVLPELSSALELQVHCDRHEIKCMRLGKMSQW